MNCENLGVSYHANQNAWMTQNVFKLWLKAFDMHMRECKVVLLLDNCSAHITVEGLVKHNIALKNTTLLYLPPNTTSKIQPFDTGIFCNFKAHYHRRFNCMLLGRIDRDMKRLAKSTFSIWFSSWSHLGALTSRAIQLRIVHPLQDSLMSSRWWWRHQSWRRPTCRGYWGTLRTYLFPTLQQPYAHQFLAQPSRWRAR